MPSSKIKIFIAGHKGMVGSAILRRLSNNKDQTQNIKIITKERKDLDLLNQQEVYNFFKSEKPDQVYLAAAKVGGIEANNNYPADFIFQNLLIQSNVIDAAFKSGTKKLLFLGSSCVYPKFAKQPMSEAALLSGYLESTNEPYAISKIAGIKMCESYNRQFGESHKIDFRSVMPTNLYGINDNYHSSNSHVIPALIKRFHLAKIKNYKKVILWGSGNPIREFLFVDDLAEACIHVMNLNKTALLKLIKPMQSHINIGSGEQFTIRELGNIIKKIIGYKGLIEFDEKKPDGTPKKVMDNDLIKKLGWQPKTNFQRGIEITYEDFKKKLEI